MSIEEYVCRASKVVLVKLMLKPVVLSGPMFAKRTGTVTGLAQGQRTKNKIESIPLNGYRLCLSKRIPVSYRQ